MSQTLLDEHGRVMQLGRRIHEGGEGYIWEVVGQPDILVKTYKKHDPELAEKLRVMPAMATPNVLKVAAWPTRLLFDSVNRTVSGIGMPRVANHQEVHQLYSPPSRRVHFPDATWAFLAHVAMNCAAAFETVHDAGHVIGDVNQSGVLVSRQGTVRLIDCDSFQVQSNGTLHCCVVGVPLFTAPELQGLSSFRGLRRTANHDNFGLALLIFHLLFMGRHPFAGRFSGAGDMPIERAITEGRFAFSARASTYQMSPPPHALGLNDLLPALGAMFEKAFALPTPGFSRPTAREWREGLLALKFATCQNDKAHVFPRNLTMCPWCRIEEQGGPAFFVSSTVTVQFDPGFDILTVWNEIKRVGAPPGPDALNIAGGRTNVDGKPLPQAARFDLIDPPNDVGDPPILAQQVLPYVKPYRSLIETIPADPSYTPLPRPMIPQPTLVPAPTPPSKPATPKDDGPLDRVAEREYLAFLWTAVLSGAADIGVLFIQPLLAIFTSVIPVAFTIGWGLLYRQRRKAQLLRLERIEWETRTLDREYKDAQDRFNVLHKRWEQMRADAMAAWERRCREAQVAWEQSEAQHKRDWQAELERLATLRVEAPAKEEVYRLQWEEERRGIEQLRVEIERHNVWAKAEWTLAVERHQRAATEAALVRQRILEAKSCFADEVRVREQRRDGIASELNGLRTSWIPDSHRFAGEWRILFDSLERARQQYETLRREYDNELAKKQANQREAQFRDFLDQILIADESIPNFKKGRKAMLAANGFETAWDVTEQALERLQGQGLGPKLISQLVDWRRDQERRFQFNPGKGMPAGEIRSLHAQFQARRQTLQRILRGGREQAEAIQLKARRRLDELQRRSNEVIATLAQADADLLVCWNIAGRPGN